MPKRKRPPRWEGAADSLLDRKPDESIDLHGLTADQAVTRVRNGLATLARSRSGSLVHIVTGKGRNSAGGAVLKPRIRALLSRELTAQIADWEPDVDEGGFLVRIR